jgi:light-regulated signal transduction histidine kinase (bacteriophytochrome)
VAVVNKELMLERPDLSRIDVLVNIAPLRDSPGRLIGAVSIFQDISELKRAQRERELLLREMKRSNRELSQFSYAVSHDLPAPVRSVRALTQLLVRRAIDSKDETAHLAELIEQATEGMERLIDSLLRYAQVGQGELNRQAISAQSIIDSVRVLLSTLIESTGARIVCSGLPMLNANAIQLEQLFQNFIANAIKYRRAGVTPEIEIRAEPLKTDGDSR